MSTPGISQNVCGGRILGSKILRKKCVNHNIWYSRQKCINCGNMKNYNQNSINATKVYMLIHLFFPDINNKQKRGRKGSIKFQNYWIPANLCIQSQIFCGKIKTPSLKFQNCWIPASLLVHSQNFCGKVKIKLRSLDSKDSNIFHVCLIMPRLDSGY